MLLNLSSPVVLQIFVHYPKIIGLFLGDVNLFELETFSQFKIQMGKERTSIY